LIRYVVFRQKITARFSWPRVAVVGGGAKYERVTEATRRKKPNSNSNGIRNNLLPSPILKAATYNRLNREYEARVEKPKEMNKRIGDIEDVSRTLVSEWEAERS